ncbi:MAG: hypothetical protein HETSPECPRED_004107 [Heterodermia speciosa]|uniref:Uncharacterized protein n=1 Tax=Heterodermia speciosa TaxID=116794 RepID=A0A8H3ILH9_9LECA|nr:MAG: hypothetical protein HETSPECPRED_004107 [Heterodermia speciosa]
MGWFGSLQLAYKYAYGSIYEDFIRGKLLTFDRSMVLGSLFVLVILAGVCKVIYNKRRLKKYTKKAQLESAHGQDERVELNKRELDEGDLFGIRAIQSGYFGGVAQSRPSSVAGDLEGEQSSASNTLLGSHPSPKVGAASPMSSVHTLPLEARHSSSPLRKTVVSTNQDRPQTSSRSQAKSMLQPSDAELHGSTNHDPAVNMYLNVPPSPTAHSRPSSSGFMSRSRSSSDGSPEETPEQSPESSTFPSRNSHYGGTYVPSSVPQIAVPNRVRDPSRPDSRSQYPEHEIHSQSASIISRDSDATIRGNNRSIRSSIQEEAEFSTRPTNSRHFSYETTPSIQEEEFHTRPTNSRHFSYERTPSIQEEEFPTRLPTGSRQVSDVSRSSIQEEEHFTVQPSRPSSGRPYSARSSSYNNPYSSHGTDVPVPKIPQATTTASAAGDWGAAIFKDIDQSIQDTRTNPSYHTSHLSDSSSIYSTAQRQSTGPQTTMDPRAHFSRISTGRGYPEQMANIAPSQELSGQSTASQTTTASEGTRRDSDASSRLPSSGDTSKTSSHRNTRELGDFYDSYWRQSQQPSPQPTSSSNSTRTEEKAREGRRQNQLEINVPTIAEVPSPLATPVPSAGIGKAM